MGLSAGHWQTGSKHSSSAEKPEDHKAWMLIVHYSSDQNYLAAKTFAKPLTLLQKINFKGIAD